MCASSFYGFDTLRYSTRRNPDGFSLPELKVACYHKLLSYLPTLTRRQINCIVYAVETYLNLTDSEKQVYERLIREIYSEVSEMITNPLIEQGRQQGIQQGKQSLLLQQLSAKFGQLPTFVAEKIRAITNEQELDTLSLRVLTANSLDEMGLNSRESIP